MYYLTLYYIANYSKTVATSSDLNNKHLFSQFLWVWNSGAAWMVVALGLA